MKQTRKEAAMFAVALPTVVLVALAVLGLAAVGIFVSALVWFARATSGKDDAPQEFPDGPQIISEDD